MVSSIFFRMNSCLNTVHDRDLQETKRRFTSKAFLSTAPWLNLCSEKAFVCRTLTHFSRETLDGHFAYVSWFLAASHRYQTLLGGSMTYLFGSFITNL
jgi:hypothetical protein